MPFIHAMMSNRAMFKVIGRRLLFSAVMCYVAVAVIYTTGFLVQTALPAILTGRASEVLSLWFSARKEDDSMNDSFLDSLGFDALPVDEQVMYWPLSDFPTRSQQSFGDQNASLAMSERLFISKAFSQSMKPSQILPFYYRASSEFQQEDITVTTLVTSNRFTVLARLVQQYAGPISVTVHVPSSPHNTTTAILNELHMLYTSTPGMSTRVDVHVMHDPFDRALNTWRNLARLLARTEYVMMLDVDFAICTDFRTRILRAGGKVKELLRAGVAALVLPAFEYLDAKDGKKFEAFPKNKKDLVKLVDRKKIDMFHRSWPPGHNSSDYVRFYESAPGEVYRVASYQNAYEPYVIFKKDGPPWCDERFVGYGGNKAACLFEMYLSGISFYVLSDDFIIHQSHPYEEAARRHERRYNRRIYSDFREETCLRYLKRFADDGALNTLRAQNAIEECKKVKGVAKLTAELLLPRTVDPKL